MTPGTLALYAVWETHARDCRNCRLWQQRQGGVPVFGVGKLDRPTIAFVGEGPDTAELAAGFPFAPKTPSGDLLATMINKMDVNPADVFYTAATLCPLQSGKRVWPVMREACEPLLLAQLRAVRPAIVVALGEVAGRSTTGLRPPPSGKWYPLYQGAAKTFIGSDVLVTQGLREMLQEDKIRRGQARRECWADLQTVMERLR